MEETLVVPRDVPLDAWLQAQGYALERDCGGRGTCGRCRVEVVAPDGTRFYVLACRARFDADGWRVVASNLSKRYDSIFSPDESSFASNARVEPSAAERRGDLALAVDLGTTTIVCALASLTTGRTLAVRSTRNPQTRFGRDVLSRIAAASVPEDAATMRGVVARAIGTLVDATTRSLRLEATRVCELVVAGNTTMESLFVGRDVSPLGRAPFEVATKTFPEYGASSFDWGVALASNARVRVFPVFSAFVGGDVLSGFARLRRLGAFEGTQTELYLDVGTNGESILGRSGKFYATSTAAGPAFEGSEISQGSLATPGAICAIERDVDAGRWQARTIGDVPAVSVCGSGLIDATSCALEFDVLAPNGRLLESSATSKIAGRLRKRDGERALLISDESSATRDGGVYVTQRDFRQAQLALGATRAGVRLLLAASGANEEELDAFYVAGGFGATLEPRSARRVGLFPTTLDASRLRSCGNASLLGALDALNDRVSWRELEETLDAVEVVELTSRPDFADVFAESLRFPE